MQVVEVSLGDVAQLPEPPFGGEAAFLILVAGDDVIGACFAPPTRTRGDLADFLAGELGEAIRTRAVLAALDDQNAWREEASGDAMPVSVVVVTKDRLVELRRCLAGLRPQIAEGDEVIVVDNSVAGTAAYMANEYGARFLADPRPGSSWARNTGFRAAANDVVVFIDDDCVPHTGWLDAMRRPFRDASVDVVTGAVVARRIELAAPLAVDIHYPFHRGWVPQRFWASTGTPDSPFDPWRLGTGASMAFRRVLLNAIDGFDPALGAGLRTGGFDDLDAFRRALAAGATVEYRPDAIVWHDHPETRRGVRRMLTRHAIGSGAEFAKVLGEPRSGRRRAIRVTLREWKWQLVDARSHFALRLEGAPSLPWTAYVLQPPSYLLGAARFLRYRRRLREGLRR